MLVERSRYMAPDLAQILFAVLGEKRRKTALFQKGVGVVLRCKFVNLPVIDIIRVPGCISVSTYACPCGTACSCSRQAPHLRPPWLPTPRKKSLTLACSVHAQGWPCRGASRGFLSVWCSCKCALRRLLRAREGACSRRKRYSVSQRAQRPHRSSTTSPPSKASTRSRPRSSAMRGTYGAQGCMQARCAYASMRRLPSGTGRHANPSGRPHRGPPPRSGNAFCRTSWSARLIGTH